MKCGIKYLFLSCICSLLSCSIQNQPNNQVSKLSLHLNDSTTVLVDIDFIVIDESFPYRNVDMWGSSPESADQLMMPKQVVSNINVQIGKEIVLVPFSAYSDLGDADSTWLEKTNDGFRLVLKGGGQATAYTAILIFSDGEIVSRKVALGEFSGSVWQETVYSSLSKEWQSKM